MDPYTDSVWEKHSQRLEIKVPLQEFKLKEREKGGNDSHVHGLILSTGEKRHLVRLFGRRGRGETVPLHPCLASLPIAVAGVPFCNSV